MSAVLVSWPDDWHESAVKEVIELFDVGDAVAEQVVNTITMRMAEGIVRGQILVGTEPPPTLTATAPQHVVEEARRLVQRGKWVNAIRLLRQHSTMGLKEGKDFVNAIKAESSGGEGQ